MADSLRSPSGTGSDFLDPNPLLDDALILRLTYDLAAGIHPADTIATRYGFADLAALRRYLTRHKQIVANAQKAKAAMESDEGSETRVRLKAMQATEALIAPTAGLAADPRIAPQQRIDAFKQLSRVSGLDASAAAIAAKGGSGGPAFTLNILFKNNPAEHLSLRSIADGAEMTSAVPEGTPAIVTTRSKAIAVGDDDEELEEI